MKSRSGLRVTGCHSSRGVRELRQSSAASVCSRGHARAGVLEHFAPTSRLRLAARRAAGSECGELVISVQASEVLRATPALEAAMLICGREAWRYPASVQTEPSPSHGARAQCLSLSIQRRRHTRWYALTAGCSRALLQSNCKVIIASAGSRAPQ
jgi:hypothetical protein